MRSFFPKRIIYWEASTVKTDSNVECIKCGMRSVECGMMGSYELRVISDD